MGLYGDNYGSSYGTGDSLVTGTTSATSTATGGPSGLSGSVSGTVDAETDHTTGGGYGSSYGYNYGGGSGGSVTGTGTVSGGTKAITEAFSFSPVQGTAGATTATGGLLTGADSAFDIGAIWKVVRNNQHVEEDLFDVKVVDNSNPFGNYAIAQIDDTAGDKFEDYTRGTRVDFEYSTNDGITYDHRFTGFVVEARELDKQGADVLEVECYSFDQFLRRESVSNDQSGNTVKQALEDIVKTDTPVSWVASNVEVGDNQTLSRSYRGERVENVLQSLRSISTGEDFGVNSSLEFFWNPREESSAARGVDNSQWFNYDLPEEGKETINEVTVWFDSGNESVTVDDGGDKLELQDGLGTPDPVTFAEEVSRPEITDIEDARDVGEEILNGRETTLTGTVTTYGLLDAEPGDVINVEIVPRGISGDFRIAEIEYNWGSDETILTLVEKKGDQDDLLVRMSDTVKRVELEGVNRDGVNNVITSTNLGVDLWVDGSVNTTSYSAWRYTNTGRNLLRDAWINSTPIDIAEIAVGNDPDKPSRTDTSLGNELERATVSQSLPDSKTVEFSASVSTTDIREIGLFTAGGELVVRATIEDTGLAGPVDVAMSLEVSEGGVENGVVTDTGQTAIRDVLADNSPLFASKYAYGSDGSEPSMADTSLGNTIITQSLDELLIQRADTTTEWASLTPTFASDRPLKVENGELTTMHTNVVKEGEAPDAPSADDVPTVSDSNFSGGEGTQHFNVPSDTIAWDVTFDHDVPADQVGVRIRDELIDDSTDADGLIWYLNENKIDELQGIPGSKSLGWINLSDSGYYSGGSNGYDGGGLKAGETYRLELYLEGSGNGEGYHIDAVSVYDRRYTYTWDDDNGGASGYLDGPETKPELEEVAFKTANTRRDVLNATADMTWNDVSGNQYIELSNDGGGTWHRTNNSQTASASFSSGSTAVDVRVGLSRYGSRTTATPQTGFKSQSVSLHELFADVDAITSAGNGKADVRAVIPPDTLTGSTIREAGQLSANDDLLTRSIFAEIGPIDSNQRIISSESTGFDA